MDAPCIAQVQCGWQTLAASSELEPKTQSLRELSNTGNTPLQHFTLAETQMWGFWFCFPFKHKSTFNPP